MFRLETVERSLHRARGTVIDESAYQNLKEMIENFLHEFRKEDIENNSKFQLSSSFMTNLVFDEFLARGKWIYAVMAVCVSVCMYVTLLVYTISP